MWGFKIFKIYFFGIWNSILVIRHNVFFLVNYYNLNTLYFLKYWTSQSQQQHINHFEEILVKRDILIFYHSNKIRTIAAKQVRTNKEWKRKKDCLEYNEWVVLEWIIRWIVNLNETMIKILWTFISFTIKKNRVYYWYTCIRDRSEVY